MTANHRIIVDPRDPTKFMIVPLRGRKLFKRTDGKLNAVPTQLPVQPRWHKPCPVPMQRARWIVHSSLPRVDSTTVQSIIDDEQESIRLEIEAYKRAIENDRQKRSIGEALIRTLFPSSSASPALEPSSVNGLGGSGLVTKDQVDTLDPHSPHYHDGHGHHQHDQQEQQQINTKEEPEKSQQQPAQKSPEEQNMGGLMELMEQVKNCSYRIHWHSYKTFMATEDIRVTLEALNKAMSQYLTDNNLKGDDFEVYLNATNYWLPDVSEMLEKPSLHLNNDQTQETLVQQLLNNNLTTFANTKTNSTADKNDDRVQVIVNSSHYLQCFGVAMEQLVIDSDTKRLTVNVKENKTEVKKGYSDAMMDLETHVMNVLC